MIETTNSRKIAFETSVPPQNNNPSNIKPNKCKSFVSSKLGIIIIISAISAVVIASVVIGVLLGIKKDDNNEEETQKKIPSETLYVKKIENFPENYILGMDLSSLIAEENSGVKYYNFENQEKDIFETLSYVGINYIRIRIWNDPYDSEGHAYGGGNNDMNTAIAIGKRATKYGMKILASFHFSDFYADPGSQIVPKAWKDLNLEQRAQAAYEFMKDSLNRFKNEGIDVGMVALGNEITDHFCGETLWPRIVKIMNATSKATREVLPECLISVHFTNPEREGSMMYFA
jgi:arabinogalactan endo-1,4-beta-galactosidase